MRHLYTLLYSWIFGRLPPYLRIDQSPIDDFTLRRCKPYFSFDNTTRTEFLPTSCKTIAYPSSGGLVLGYFTAVEVEHLNLSRIEPAKRSSDPAEEDELALRMLHLGAHWWPTWDLYAYHSYKISELYPYDYHFPPNVEVGYPSSGKGLWVFKFSADEQAWEEEDDRKSYLNRKPDDWDATINMALTMDERCEVLKRFNATFYENVEDCEDIPNSLEDGIQEGQRYEERLKKMEDPMYVDRWLGY